MSKKQEPLGLKATISGKKKQTLYKPACLQCPQSIVE